MRKLRRNIEKRGRNIRQRDREFEKYKQYIATRFIKTPRTFTVTPHKGFENPLKIAKLMRYAAGIES